MVPGYYSHLKRESLLLYSRQLIGCFGRRPG
jgi:hypothetical protein